MTTTPSPTLAAPFGSRSLPTAMVLACIHPLWLRLQRGEGQLVLVAVGLAAVRDSAPANLIRAGLVTTLLLASLYSFNDLHDRHDDLVDPNKDHRFARFLDRYAPLVLATWCVLAVVVLGAGFLLLGAPSACAIGIAFALNTGYSLWWKGVPGVDVLIAGAWGAAIAAVSGVFDWPLLLLVFAMTTACHLFQIRRDHTADAHVGVHTLSVARPGAVAVVMSASFVAMGCVISAFFDPWLGASSILPLALTHSRVPNQIAWLLAKAWFAIAFSLVLLARTS